MEVLMTKMPNGALAPLDDDQLEKTRKWKTGSVVRGEFAVMRNGSFFRKFWVLMDIAFDLWSFGLTHQQHLGQTVLPEKNKFRKDVTILAGFFRPVFEIDGRMTLEAESISWSSMTEDRFEALYSACIDVILAKVLSHTKMTREQLDASVDAVMRFA
jgi:hypothetical protein